MIYLRLCWEWVQKWWRSLVCALLALGGFGLGLWVRRKDPVVPPAPVPGPSPEQQAEEYAAFSLEQQAQQTRDKAEADLASAHASALSDQIAVLQKKAEGAVGDVNTTNQDLLNIGQQIRGTK